jgi:hypothetical protein
MAKEKEETKYYCYLESWGASTNLQLYSLYKAYEEWHRFSSDYKCAGEDTEHLKERLVFVVSCLGLSLSQLLGQNAVKIKKKIDRPDALLAAFLNESRYSKNKKKLLNKKFKEFIQYYDACRHFGKAGDNKVWKQLDSLNYTMVEKFIHTTLDIWNAVIKHHRSEYIEGDDIKDILNGYM